jgi:cell division inhibitor SepF
VGFWHRAKVMLGLADDYDEEYEDYDRHGHGDEYEDAPPRDTREYSSPYGDASTSVQRVEREPEPSRPRRSSMDTGRAATSRDAGSLRSVSSSWGEPERPAQPQVKMHIVEPRSFSEAQTIADKLKADTPVIMNLASTDPDLAKRLIDFASGLTYGLDGGLQKVADRVFMLTPANVAVSAEDRRRLRDKGLFSVDG